MKKLLFFFFSVLSMTGIAQEHLSLDDCYLMARKNSPIINRLNLQSAISELKKANIRTADYPSIESNLQTSYQSDVTKLNLPVTIPGLKMSSLSKDHYKITVDIKQNIYDGGLKKSRLNIEEADNKAEESKIETDLYQTWNNLCQSYFSAFLTESSAQVQKVRRQVLTERLKNLESGVRNGVVNPNEKDLLRVEIMQTDQNINELNIAHRAAFKVLSVLTGKELNEQTALSLPDINTESNGTRPELISMELQAKELDASSALTAQTRKPQIFGFAQAGYGRPGLNMLDNSFAPWGTIGVGAHWTITDWKQSKRQQQQIAIQKDAIETSRKSFLQNQQIALISQEEEITRLTDLLKSDESIIEVRSRIARRSASSLDNGNLTAADYMTDLNAETQSRLSLESHRIQLAQAKVQSDIIKGKYLSNTK